MTRPNAKGAEDAAFDSIYPPSIRAISRRYWTPVDVARRAALLFREAGVRRVLDVGSGVGKFVLVAAAVAPEVTFVGVEQRARLVEVLARAVALDDRQLRRLDPLVCGEADAAHLAFTPPPDAGLVEVARRAHQRLRLPNAVFTVGEATASSWRGFDGLYFFNPFAENLFLDGEQVDDAVELTEARFFRDIVRTERALREASLGTSIVTYHGMSGRMPACYELSQSMRAGSDWLRLWVKTREHAEGFFLEHGDDVVLHRADGALA